MTVNIDAEPWNADWLRRPSDVIAGLPAGANVAEVLHHLDQRGLPVATNPDSHNPYGQANASSVSSPP